MDGLVLPAVLLGGLLLATFWLYVYCYVLYRVGRWIAIRYRTRPAPTLTVIGMISGLLAAPCFFLPTDIIWKSVFVFGVWITHTQAVGSGFWGGMELGQRDDDTVFKERTEEWLREWEEPVRKGNEESQ